MNDHERDYDAWDDIPLFKPFIYVERETRKILLAIALVCKGWALPIQALLWRKVILTREIDAKACLRSPAFGRHRTTDLTIQGNLPGFNPDGNGNSVGLDTAVEVIKGFAMNLTTNSQEYPSS